jgi:hypothetical protein
MTKQLFLSFDIEADGPNPAQNSMVSIGIWGFTPQGKEVVSYQRNIEPHPTRVADQRTKEEFWDKNPEIKKFVQTNQISAEKCMREIGKLYTDLQGKGYKITWVARPSGYDWGFLNVYFHTFHPDQAKKPWIGFSAKCISSVLWGYELANNLSADEKNSLWDELTEKAPFTHNPLDDAKFQGKLLINMMKKMGSELFGS